MHASVAVVRYICAVKYYYEVMVIHLMLPDKKDKDKAGKTRRQVNKDLTRPPLSQRQGMTRDQDMETRQEKTETET
jgi:hypothetical protein